jgi:phosphoglycerate kinase
MAICINQVPQDTFQGQRVLVREDLNVPLNPDKTVASNHRIVETLPTLNYLLDAGATVILLSHMGRPKGTVNLEFTLAPVAEELQRLLPNRRVVFIADTDNDAIRNAVQGREPGSLILLENTRFNPGEEKNDPELAKFYASLGDIFVHDAFGTSHRAHASTEGIAHHVSKVYSGLLMNKELTYLQRVLETPERPLVGIIGGSKVSSKIAVLENLCKTVDTLIIGGAMVFTFLKARGLEVGKSLYEAEFIETAKQIETLAASLGKTVLLPKDIIVAAACEAGQATQCVAIDAIPADMMGLDIGPESIRDIEAVLQNAKTVLWNGPLGVFEISDFATGTNAVAKTLVELTQSGQLTSILGGGDTQSAIKSAGYDNTVFSHVSTGGGASLEYLEGQTLPGLAVLETPVPA